MTPRSSAAISPALAKAQRPLVSPLGATAAPAAAVVPEAQAEELTIDEAAALKIVIPRQRRAATTTRRKVARAPAARPRPTPMTRLASAPAASMPMAPVQPPSDSKAPIPRLRRELPQVEIQGAYGRVNGRVRQCAKPSGATGIARLQFRVDPSGKVVWAKLLGNMQPAAFAQCATWHVKRLDFGPWQGKPKTATIAVDLGNPTPR